MACQVNSLDTRSMLCPNWYYDCNPSGQRNSSVADFGDPLSTLYIDFLDAKTGEHKDEQDVAGLVALMRLPDLSTTMCCFLNTQCLLISELDVPFCYDRDGTDYFLPDGSYGSILSGNYTAADGSSANLYTGYYLLKNGSTGNFYDSSGEQMAEASRQTTPSLATPTGTQSDGEVRHISVIQIRSRLTTYTSLVTTPDTIRPYTYLFRKTYGGLEAMNTIDPETETFRRTVETTVITTITSIFSHTDHPARPTRRPGPPPARPGDWSNNAGQDRPLWFAYTVFSLVFMVSVLWM
ncbi:MAG: hypothetical protein M1817_002013 [Caeruleum heppii]|nr:MAG: hypothetical protein M1817_002013 [Caeruleum heppii]